MPLPSSAEISAYYDDRNQKLLRGFIRGNRRVAYAVQLVKNTFDGSGQSVLDVGCGIGATSFAYSQVDDRVRVHGVDISQKSIEIAEALFRSKNVTFSVSDMSVSPDGGPFNIVALIDVYEHVPRDGRRRFNQVLSTCLAADGTLVLTAPSPLHQEYLRVHQPDGLQIVDETVDLDDLLQLGRDIDATLTYYKLVPVWSSNQYIHAVFERDPRYEPCTARLAGTKAFRPSRHSQDWEAVGGHTGAFQRRSSSRICPTPPRRLGRIALSLVFKELMRVCIVQRSFTEVETFIRAHDERLPGVVGILSRDLGKVALDGEPVLCDETPRTALRRITQILQRRGKLWEIDRAYETAFRRTQADVVLAEYGTAGVRVLRACRQAAIPLVVHFHGADASKYKVLSRYSEDYRRLFTRAAAVIAVSRAMERRLLSLGCPSEKLIYSPYGVDCDTFVGSHPLIAPPQFLAVGRMVEKKGPNLTLMAFARVLEQRPDARLRMIGGGDLLATCRDLATSLALDHAVAFLGSQSHETVREEMRYARAFVQHSVTAADGDSEGTPVSILEAGAAGLPVVSTRHAGIPDVVVEGKTGLLVDEGRTDEMAQHMLTLANDPKLADELGRHAALHVRLHYTMTRSINRLADVLAAAASGSPIALVREAIEADFLRTEPIAADPI